MKSFALVSGVVVLVSGTCQQAGLAALTDPAFGWLPSGTSAERADKVASICASDTNPDRTAFNARLDDLNTQCASQQANSPLGLTLQLLNTVLCEKKGTPQHFCVLSLLPLFDINYFLSLQGGDMRTPSLQAVADDLERQKAMCVSSECNAYLESIVPTLLSNMTAGSPEATFIRGTVNRMRCGCAVPNVPCFSTTSTQQLVHDNGAGELSLIDAQACDGTGVVAACARSFVNCESIPLPKCARPCAVGDLATVKFGIKNLNWECLRGELASLALPTIKADVIANVPGLLDSDFGCECAAAAAPATGTQCTCHVTCNALTALKNFDIAARLATLQKHAAAVVVPLPNIDSKVNANCKFTADDLSFGSSFQLISASANAAATETNAASSVASSLLSLLVGCVFLGLVF